MALSMGKIKVTIVDWRAAAAIGLALPYLALQETIARRIAPVLDVLGAGQRWSFELPLLIATLGLVLAGAAYALQPALRAGDARRYPIVNLLVAAVLLAGFAYEAVGLTQGTVGCTLLRFTICI